MRLKQALVCISIILSLLAMAWPVSAEIRLRPDQACKFLRGLGLKAGPYQRKGDWYVCEAVKTLTGGKQPNTISYQVVGAKEAVQELRLELSVDEPRRQGEAKGLMAEAALHLARKVGAPEAPDGLEEAVRRSSEGRWTAGQAIITLIKHPMPDPPRGYKLVFTAR